MSAQVEELGENRVRLTVDVSPHELEHAVEHATNDLSESVKIPGLPQGEGADAGARLEDRQGPDLGRGGRVAHQRLVLGGGVAHAPAPDLAARVRLRAADDGQGGLVVLGHDRGAADARDRRLDDARGAARRGRGPAGARRPGARGAAPDRRRARARRRPARRRTATRSSSTCVSPSGEAQSDTVVELGSGRLVEEIEAALVGASVGETKEVAYELADESGAAVTITVKHVNEKVLPRARRRAGALRERVRHARRAARGHRGPRPDRGRGGDRRRVPGRRRRRARHRVERPGRPARSSRRARASCSTASSARSAAAASRPTTYFQVTGQSPEVLVAQMHAEAAQSVARELALEAVADKAGIEISDDDVKALIREQAEESGDDPEQVIEDIWAHGHQESLREDLRLRARARPARRRREADLAGPRGGARQALDA